MGHRVCPGCCQAAPCQYFIGTSPDAGIYRISPPSAVAGGLALKSEKSSPWRPMFGQGEFGSGVFVGVCDRRPQPRRFWGRGFMARGVAIVGRLLARVRRAFAFGLCEEPAPPRPPPAERRCRADAGDTRLHPGRKRSSAAGVMAPSTRMKIWRGPRPPRGANAASRSMINRGPQRRRDDVSRRQRAITGIAAQGLRQRQELYRPARRRRRRAGPRDRVVRRPHHGAEVDGPEVGGRYGTGVYVRCAPEGVARAGAKPRAPDRATTAAAE